MRHLCETSNVIIPPNMPFIMQRPSSPSVSALLDCLPGRHGMENIYVSTQHAGLLAVEARRTSPAKQTV